MFLEYPTWGRPFRFIPKTGTPFSFFCLFQWYSEALGLDWLGFGPTSSIPMGPGHSSSLCIGGDSSVVPGSGQMGGESDRLAVVALRDAPGEPPFPLGKSKDKIDEIKYPVGSEYLRSTVQNALAVGPSRVEPLYGEVFTR